MSITTFSRPGTPLVLFLALLVGFSAACVGEPPADEAEATRPLSPEEYPDPASATVPIAGVTVGVVGAGVIVENHSVKSLRNVEVVINEGGAEGGFRFYVASIGSNTTNTYLAQVFKSTEGQRLNPMATKVENFALYADTPRGRGFWRGEY